MTNEALTLIQKRQAIERGLTPYLDHHNIEQALWHWEKTYGNQPSFVLNRFIHDICSTADLKLHRKEMLKKVLFEISKIEKSVKIDLNAEDFGEELVVQTNVSNAFFYFVRSVIEQVPEQDGYDFSQDVKKQLVRDGIRIRTDRNIQNFEFLDVIPAKHFSQVITTLYQNYCIYYGPTKADLTYATIKLNVKQQHPTVDMHQLI